MFEAENNQAMNSSQQPIYPGINSSDQGENDSENHDSQLDAYDAKSYGPVENEEAPIKHQKPAFGTLDEFQSDPASYREESKISRGAQSYLNQRLDELE